jgi:DNA-binding NarL/FixJ family response regulator
MIRLLVVDDHPLFRKGLVALIKDEIEDCEVLEAEDGNDAIKELENSKFDFAILDIDMPEKSGMDVLDYIAKKEIAVRPIILTMHNDELFFNEAFNRGAKGFLLKEDSSNELIECLHKVTLNLPFVSSKLKPFLKNRSEFTEKLNVIKSAIKSLTKSELNTIRLVAENKTSKEIAELLFVTEKSVENYRSRACKKLDISGGSNSLYKWCVENKEHIKQSV